LISAGAYSAPTDPLAGFKGLSSKGRGEEEKEREGRRREGRERKGEERGKGAGKCIQVLRRIEGFGLQRDNNGFNVAADISERMFSKRQHKV